MFIELAGISPKQRMNDNELPVALTFADHPLTAMYQLAHVTIKATEDVHGEK